MASCWTMRVLLLAAWSLGCAPSPWLQDGTWSQVVKLCPRHLPGEAFSCYTCERPTAIQLCTNTAPCKLEDTACKTTLEKVESEFPFNQSPMVTRSCSSSCLATDPDGIGDAHPVFCCFTDLCNKGFPGMATRK